MSPLSTARCRTISTFFSNATINTVQETEQCFNAEFISFNCTTGFHGARWGVEYQGDLSLHAFGSLIFGARTMTEYRGHVPSAQSRRWIIHPD